MDFKISTSKRRRVIVNENIDDISKDKIVIFHLPNNQCTRSLVFCSINYHPVSSAKLNKNIINL